MHDSASNAPVPQQSLLFVEEGEMLLPQPSSWQLIQTAESSHSTAQHSRFTRGTRLVWLTTLQRLLGWSSRRDCMTGSSPRPEGQHTTSRRGCGARLPSGSFSSATVMQPSSAAATPRVHASCSLSNRPAPYSSVGAHWFAGGGQARSTQDSLD